MFRLSVRFGLIFQCVVRLQVSELDLMFLMVMLLRKIVFSVRKLLRVSCLWLQWVQVRLFLMVKWCENSVDCCCFILFMLCCDFCFVCCVLVVVLVQFLLFCDVCSVELCLIVVFVVVVVVGLVDFVCLFNCVCIVCICMFSLCSCCIFCVQLDLSCFSWLVSVCMLVLLFVVGGVVKMVFVSVVSVNGVIFFKVCMFVFCVVECFF